MALPLLETLQRRLGLEPREGRLLVLMGALVGVLLCAYTLAKVLRDALFLTEYGALSLPYGYIGVALASAIFVGLEIWMARHFTRVGATRFTQYLAIAFSVAAAAFFPLARHPITAVFYLWTGSQTMMLLPHFWVLALDSWDSRRARRVFPLLTGCGLVGGLAGGGIAGWLTPIVHRDGLLWILSGLLVVSHLLTRVAEGMRLRRLMHSEVAGGTSPWQIVLRSRYIQLLAAGLALSVAVSTLVDFQFKFFLQKLYPDPHALTRFLGFFYVGLNGLALLFQFSAAGWLLQRMGLGASTGLQPTTVLLFASWLTVSGGAWVVVAMRWMQGVVFQTLGKSSSEIYYSAIHPRERRRIKPAIDTLVDRWADAAVGVLLIVVLRLFRVPIPFVALVTGLLAASWLVVLLALNRQYGRSFGEALSARWVEPEAAAEWAQLPSARKAMLAALEGKDERQAVAALEMCVFTRDKGVRQAVRQCLHHSSPSVRVAAVAAMEGMRLADPEGVIEGFLADPHEGVRRAAVAYLIAMEPRTSLHAHRLLEGEDPVLRQFALDALLDHPERARDCLSAEWIDARLKSGARDDLLVAARALGAMDGGVGADRLRGLLAHPDVEVRRAALLSAARRPNGGLLELVLPMLFVPELSYEAHQAMVALGDPAVPALAPYLTGERGTREQSLAAHALGDIGGRRAVRALLGLVRSRDVRQRHLGLAGLARARVGNGQPVLPQPLVHSLFLRELREYRLWVEPGRRLLPDPVPEVHLLGESCIEAAEMALARGLNALACWYKPSPLFGAFERLRSQRPEAVSPALEYLGHVLPARVFRPVAEAFEDQGVAIPEGESDGNTLERTIRLAWKSGDGWLRACAVRASRRLPHFDAAVFAMGEGEEEIVVAEVRALSESAGQTVPAEARP